MFYSWAIKFEQLETVFINLSKVETKCFSIFSKKKQYYMNRFFGLRNKSAKVDNKSVFLTAKCSKS